MYFAVTMFLVSVIGYLLGSINTSLVVGRFYKIDIRQHGSGNPGMTNALRTLGKFPTIIVALGDLLKGVLSCWIAIPIVESAGGDRIVAVVVAGIAAVIGHNWPVYFGFKGGKGVLTTFAVLLMMDWKIALFLLSLFIVIVAITRYVSLGSIICLCLFPILSIILHKQTIFIIGSIILVVISLARHRGNISRLVKGTENKLSAH